MNKGKESIVGKWRFWMVLPFLPHLGAAPGVIAPPPPQAPVAQAAAPAETELLADTLDRVRQLLLRQPFQVPSAAEAGPASSGEITNAASVLDAMYASNDPALRVRAVEGWAAAGEGEALPQLLQAILDPAPEVRDAAAAALKQHPAQELGEMLLARLNAQDPALLQAAAEVLPALAERVGPVYLELFQAEDTAPQDRLACSYALGLMRYAPAATALADGIYSADTALSRTCAYALLAHGATAQPKAWPELLYHPDPEIAFLAVGAVADIGGAQSFESLVKMAAGLISEEQGPQVAALEAVAAYPDPQSVPALIQIMAQNARLGTPINKVLTRKTRRDYGPNAFVWGDWWFKQTGQTLTLLAKPATTEETATASSPGPITPRP